MKINLWICLSVMFLGLLSGCVTRNNPGVNHSKIPALQGYAPATSALPPPNDYQANSAFEASTMVPPPRN